MKASRNILEESGEVSIRRTEPEDAEKRIAYFTELLTEPRINLALDKEEINTDVESVRQLIVESSNLDNSIFLIVETANDRTRIIGELSLKGDRYRSTRHVASLGMTIHRDFRGKGIGGLMLDKAFEWARSGNIIKRIELEVYARNEPAIRLYEKYGFKYEGRKQAYVFQDNEYHDVLMMGLLI